MKRLVSSYIACMVLSYAFTALAQESQEDKKWVENRVREITEILETVTAPNDLPRDLGTLMNMAVVFSPQARKARAELDAIRTNIARDVSAAFTRREKYLSALMLTHSLLQKNPGAYRNFNNVHVVHLRKSEEALRELTGLTLNQYPSIDTLFVPIDSIRNIHTFRADRATQVTKRTPENFPEPERLKSALDGEPANVTFKEMPLRNILSLLAAKAEININVDILVADEAITLDLEHVTLRKTLLALADQVEGLTFVSRDYGLFATTRDRAIRISGATIPDDVPYIADIPSGLFRSGFAAGAGFRGFGAGGGGFGGGFGGGGFAMQASPRMPQPRPAYEERTPENLRKILEGTIGTTFEDTNVMDILDFISDTYEINITVDLAFAPPTIRQIDLKNVPMRSALLALTDKMGDACFVIRDYGLFLTTRERAQTLAGVTIPEDVPYFAPAAPHQIQRGFGAGGGGIGGGGGAIPPPQNSR